MISFNTPEFYKLQKEWYARLKKSGFVDVELDPRRFHTVNRLNRQYGNWFEGHAAQDGTAEYYYRASHYAHVMEEGEEKEVWSLHAEGLSVPKIAKKRGWSVSYVEKMIYRLRESFKEYCKDAIEEENNQEIYDEEIYDDATTGGYGNLK